MTDIKQILEFDRLARSAAGKYRKKRGLYDSLFTEKGRHFTGIVGPRGAGKTVLLKQLALARQNSFYLSADTLDEKDDLFEIAKLLNDTYKIKSLFLDEIHFSPGYQRSLKQIYDSLDMRVIFTSSVALSLTETAVDLSRRIKLVSLFPFTLREFILFKTGTTLPALTISNILNKQWTAGHMMHEQFFEPYLKGGLMPFSLDEPDIFPLLRNILEKVISNDIPSVADISVQDTSDIRKCVAFIGKSPVDGINYSSLSRNAGISKYKAELFIRLLEKAFILNQIFPSGTNVLREPKILMCLPYRLLFSEYETAIGALREDFFVEAMRMNNFPVNYLKTTRGEKTPDFLVQTGKADLVIEIGGKGKGREQFKGVKNKKALILSHSGETNGIRRPLFLAGYL